MSSDLVVFVDLCLLALIWIVQLKVYPSFEHKETSRFRAWHAQYTNLMGYVAGPLMILQLAGACFLCVVFPSAANFLYLMLVLSTWLVTFCLAVPIHRTLQEVGNARALTDCLISVNWIRTILWTLTGGFAFIR